MDPTTPERPADPRRPSGEPAHESAEPGTVREDARPGEREAEREE